MNHWDGYPAMVWRFDPEGTRHNLKHGGTAPAWALWVLSTPPRRICTRYARSMPSQAAALEVWDQVKDRIRLPENANTVVGSRQ